MDAHEFITDARMHGWDKEDKSSIYSMLSFEVNPNVTEADKKIKVGIYLFNASFDSVAVREAIGNENFSGFASGFYNCFNQAALNSVSTGYAQVGGDTVGEVLARQQELIAAYQDMIDKGILTPNSMMLPANGGQFTSAWLGVDFYDDEGNVTSGTSFQLDAIPKP
ncbi:MULTISPECIES: hypothetical protein [Serratia]|uniref:hypothetical protein n=1 Tax=Serratia TaxID=613 RepID=UPI000742F85D|nr:MULTISPECIES: hypothetical protein [Serratia]ALX96196.1 hypothetical protein AV650_22855 [Serratia fonticola]MBC3249682.1 hypothetical protein [Serratia fonticola]MBL5829137.1 hypothetical protein [Serratia fonticola]MBL5903048.1 hypothetical protein [Serratia fonticola]MBP1000421.1 hypothetical protein [Serratia fonticola]